ncbi:MAG: competence/damage-inducible protein A [Alphaproteobacteria bacterium]|nr:competence/damage-inducible protein A [Alphaproteobacteria bacterium]
MPSNAVDPDKSSYNAALLVIGNEILSGRTEDKNINWIAKKLVEKGITFSEVRVVPDNAPRVIAAVRELSGLYDYLFTTGGIGPTHDDITAECVALAFDAPLEQNKEALALLVAHYGGSEHLNPGRLKMAQIPRGADLIPNPVSGAPGFILRNVHVMAGVPRIMQAMLDHVLSTLKGGALVHSCTVTSQLPESRIAEGLADLQKRWPNVEIGSYPHFQAGNFGVSLVLRSTDQDALAKAEADVKALVMALEGAA